MRQITSASTVPVPSKALPVPDNFSRTFFFPDGSEAEYCLSEGSGTDVSFQNCIEIGHCSAQNGSIRLRGECAPIQTGAFTLLASGVPHAYLSEDTPCSWEYLLFPLSMLPDTAEYTGISMLHNLLILRPALVITGSCQPFLHFLLRQLFAEAHAQETRSCDRMHGLLLAALTEFSRILPASCPASEEENRYSAVLNALAFFQAHYAEPANIARIASENHLSESYFRKIFKAATGVSPLEYLQNYRIQKACRYLLKGKLTAREISALVGFPSISSFNRQFQQALHTSPSDWKRTRQPAIF